MRAQFNVSLFLLYSHLKDESGPTNEGERHGRSEPETKSALRNLGGAAGGSGGGRRSRGGRTGTRDGCDEGAIARGGAGRGSGARGSAARGPGCEVVDVGSEERRRYMRRGETNWQRSWQTREMT